MSDKTILSPETLREIEKLASDMLNGFAPPEFIPGCEVKSLTDKDIYDTDNGWIEAICGRHNQQRCRWKNKFSGVQVGDYVDVIYFKSIRLFEVFGKGGSGSVATLPLTTKGDLLGFSTLPARVPVSGNDGYVLTKDSAEALGVKWAAAAAGGWPYSAVKTVDPTDTDADYATITTAIAGATALDTVLIGNGTYSESVTLNKKLYLKGVSREGVIITHNATNGFANSTADCVVENLTIKNTAAGASTVVGIQIGANITFRNCLIDMTGLANTGGNSIAIQNNGAYTVTFENCEILIGNASVSVVIGYYSTNAAAVAIFNNGRIYVSASGGNSYELYRQAGYIATRDVVLQGGGVYDSGANGSYSGRYSYAEYLMTFSAIYPDALFTPDIGSVSNPFGSVYLASGKDIYPGGNAAGLFQRVNAWAAPTYHFKNAAELSDNFTWDATNFAGTPSTISDSFKDLLLIYNSTAADFFAYRTLASTGTVTIRARVAIGSLATAAHGYGGIRIDNPAAPTTNFFEVRLIPGSAEHGVRLHVRYNTGAGLVQAYYADFLPAQFVVLGLAYIDASNTGPIYYTIDGPRLSFVTNTVPTWSSATVRAGIITGLVGGAAGSADRGAYFDLWSV